MVNGRAELRQEDGVVLAMLPSGDAYARNSGGAGSWGLDPARKLYSQAGFVEARLCTCLGLCGCPSGWQEARQRDVRQGLSSRPTFRCFQGLCRPEGLQRRLGRGHLGWGMGLSTSFLFMGHEVEHPMPEPQAMEASAVAEAVLPEEAAIPSAPGEPEAPAAPAPDEVQGEAAETAEPVPPSEAAPQVVPPTEPTAAAEPAQEGEALETAEAAELELPVEPVAPAEQSTQAEESQGA